MLSAYPLDFTEHYFPLEGFVLPLFKRQPLPANTLVLPGYSIWTC